MKSHALDHLIADQQKLLLWHLKNAGIHDFKTISPHLNQFKPLVFSPTLMDHTLLKAQATLADIELHCEQAIGHNFATVCVNASFLPEVVKHLAHSTVQPICVVGFPLGCVTTEQKAFETTCAIEVGAQEIDMVMHVGLLKSKNYKRVYQDIQEVVQAAQGHAVKVILETCLLSQIEKIQACFLSGWAGASFVKTSTGFSTGGATVSDVALMRKIVGPHIGVKASGGVKTFDDAFAMLNAGASRLGTSSSVSIIQNQNEGVRDESETSKLY